MLRFRYKMRPRKFSSTMGLGSGQEGRIKRMRMLVTSLIRFERIESTYEKCDEARGYAERLIQVAAQHGDQHAPTMEMADYWLLEKDLIHKLFKVLVPRYHDWKTSLTQIYQLPITFPGDGSRNAILELKGNPWPPVLPRERDTRFFFSNVLLEELRKEKTGKTSSSRVIENISNPSSGKMQTQTLSSRDLSSSSGLDLSSFFGQDRSSSSSQDVDHADDSTGGPRPASGGLSEK